MTYETTVPERNLNPPEGPDTALWCEHCCQYEGNEDEPWFLEDGEPPCDGCRKHCWRFGEPPPAYGWTRECYKVRW